MAELKIRPFKEEDLEYLDTCTRTIYSDEYGFSDKYVNELIAGIHDFAPSESKYRENFWVAELEGEPVGMIALQGTYDPEMGRISFLAVPKQMRRRGIGKYLMEVAETSAKGWEYTSLVLNVPSTLRPAMAFFIKRRFTLLRTEERDDWRDGIVLDETWGKRI